VTNKRELGFISARRARSAIALIGLGLVSAVAVQLWPVQSAYASVARFGTPTTATTTGATSVSIAKPTGATSSHVLIATVTINGTGTATTDQICPPAGWTSVARTTNTGIVQEVFRNTGGDAGPFVFSFKATSCATGGAITRRASSGIVAYSGVDTAAPIAAATSPGTTGTSGTMGTGSFTTATGNFLVAAFGIASNTNVSPIGATEAFDVSGGAGAAPNGPTTQVEDTVLSCNVSASATCAASLNASFSAGGAAPWVAHLIALKRGGNVAPTANAGSSSPNEDAVNHPITLSGSDTDPENCNLDFSIVTGPANGTLGAIANNACVSGATNNDTATVPYTPAANFNGSDSFTFKVNDGLTDSATATVSITVNPVNDAPAGSDNNVTTNEDTTYTFASVDFPFSDAADAPAPNAFAGLQITTLPAAGTLKLSGSTFTVPQDVTLANIPNLTFEPGLNANGTAYATFNFKVRDNGGTANGGVDLDPTANTMTIDVTAVNDAPVNSVPGAQTTPEDTANVFSAANSNLISISDIDAGSNEVKVTLAVTNGTLTLGGTTNLTFSVGDGVADSTMTFTGTLTNINAALATVTYNPTANFNGSDTLSITTDDQGNTGNGGALSDIDNVVINVTSVNDAPVNTVPGAQTTNEDTARVFSSGNSNQISIADVDAGSNAVQVTLGVVNGTLTLGSTTGLSFAGGDGTADPTMTFTGTLTDINAALATVTYNPTANFNGSDTLSMTTNDQGNTGGGALSDIDNVVITVNSVNDAPAGTNATVGTLLNTPYLFSAADFGFSDPNDAPPNTFSAVTITTLPTAGTLQLSNVNVTAGQSIPVASIPNLSFTPATNAFGSPYATFTFQVQDNGGTANSGVDLDQSPNTITINVTALPMVTVIKQVVNDNGQAATPADFTITVNGTNVDQPTFAGQDTPGVTVTMDPGSYSVTESGPFDYAGSFSSGCSGSLTFGQTATCTITNNDLPLDCSIPTIVGTAGPDTIVGTPGDDVIDGLGGADNIRGLGGRDVICGGDGSETLIDGGPGIDILWGGPGNDTIRGGDDIDRLIGEAGFDDLDGQLGIDLVFGMDDADFARGGGDTDFVFGGLGSDTLQGNAADDALFGEAGSDILAGNDGNDYLFGGSENDTLNGGIGTDECHGEDGAGDSATACEVVDGVP
jgi:Ca2+-binding RTX toxin-like protein